MSTKNSKEKAPVYDSAFALVHAGTCHIPCIKVGGTLSIYISRKEAQKVAADSKEEFDVIEVNVFQKI